MSDLDLWLRASESGTIVAESDAGLNGNFWGSPGRPTVPAPVKLKLSVEALAGDRALRMFETMKCKVRAQITNRNISTNQSNQSNIMQAVD